MANERPDIIKAFNNLQSYINEVHSDTNLTILRTMKSSANITGTGMS